MAINPDLLVSAAVLQDYFVDNVTGQAMAGGIITMFQDGQRKTLKNWYYQTGPAGGPYTYLPLDNPMTLSAIGTIVDPSGADVIPFYYPFSEDDESVSQTYYVTVVDANLQDQFTRSNFPSHAGGGGGGGITGGSQFQNIIANNVFYQPSLVNSPLTFTGAVNSIIAPSQHDGFMAQSGNEHRFIKDSSGATDIITFIPFNRGDNPFAAFGQPAPVYPLNIKCTIAGSGSVVKKIQIPLNINLQTLSNQNVTFSIWAIGISGTQTLQFSITQFPGSDSLLAPKVTNFGPTPTMLNNAWTQYIFSFTMPSATGFPASATGDDALYLNIGLPRNALFELDIAKPALYLGTISSKTVKSLPDFQTNDQIDQIIASPRTGDVRVSLNQFAPWGWALCNDLFIGSPGSGAEFNSVATWNLYALLYLNVSNTYAPVTGGRSGSTIATAAADFVANKKMQLPKQLGNAIASQGLSSLGSTTWVLGQNGGAQQHTMTPNELAQHTHDRPGTNSFITTGGGGLFAPTGSGSTSLVTGGISSWAGPTPFDLTQPTTFYNVLLKL